MWNTVITHDNVLPDFYLTDEMNVISFQMENFGSCWGYVGLSRTRIRNRLYCCSTDWAMEAVVLIVIVP